MKKCNQTATKLIEEENQKRTLYFMCCEDEGEYELWFDENKECIWGYYCDDATWRSEYFTRIFKTVNVDVVTLKYDEKLAEKGRKKIFGL